MKLLEIATAAAKRVAAPITGVVKAAVRRPGDPWYSDDERRAEVNARSARSLEDWIPRRARNWLRRDGGW